MLTESLVLLTESIQRYPYFFSARFPQHKLVNFGFRISEIVTRFTMYFLTQSMW